jgi:hypothetical protein
MQYRDALGDLAAALPQVVQRASEEWRVEPGMRLIFRARHSVRETLGGAQGEVVRALYEAVDKTLLVAIREQRPVVLSYFMNANEKTLLEEIAALESQIRNSQDKDKIEDARSKLDAKSFELARIQPPEDWQHVFSNAATLAAIKDLVLDVDDEVSDPKVRELARRISVGPLAEWEVLRLLLLRIGSLFSHEGRMNLPDVLDRLKHEIRRNPVQELTQAREELKWLTHAMTDECSLLLETLDHSLGAVAVGEILRRKGLFAKFVTALDGIASAPANAGSPAWEPLLRKTFAAIGYPLGTALTLLAQNTRERSEFVLLDHAHNRMFGIREGELGFDRKSGREIEIYALREGRSYFTSTSRSTLRTLPHRIHDAAVGMAVWTADRREVQSVLDSDPQRPQVRLRAWDMGANRTPLVLFVVHYRESDITEPGGGYPADGPRDWTNDEHFELGLGCFVAPRNDPLAIGMMVLGALPVSMPKAVEVGREIWGYNKVHVSADKWDVRYRPDVMTCVLKMAANLSLRVQLPRGGSRSSSRIPLLSYTTKFGQLHRNVLTRSGAGETLRVGGHGVEVSVKGPKEWWKGGSAGGKCRSLLMLLYQFGIARDESTKGRRASYSLWTEHLQGEQGPPCLVPATFEREDE